MVRILLTPVARPERHDVAETDGGPCGATGRREEVAAGNVHQQPLRDVRMSAQMNPSHPAGLEQARERTLQQHGR